MLWALIVLSLSFNFYLFVVTLGAWFWGLFVWFEFVWFLGCFGADFVMVCYCCLLVVG